ncbi:hypothetical protein [Actinospica robiniae]|uniref:hypothetical protein n=1 Tax=Actinospica robiniae TaxID=304901 RepID=UPI00041A3D63|nr:hypothetical protein [Actinospica robiniae]
MTSDGEHGRALEAERVYLRTLDEVAAQQVAAVAEDIVSEAWMHELERARTLLLGSFEEVWDRARIRRTPSDASDDLERLRTEIDAVEGEIERVCLGAISRSRTVREALGRLRSAWVEAYGPDEIEVF